MNLTIRKRTATLILVLAGALPSLTQTKRTVLKNVTIVRNGNADTTENYANEKRDKNGWLLNVETLCSARIPYPPSKRDLRELKGLPLGDTATTIFFASSTCLLDAGAKVWEYTNSPQHRCVVNSIPVDEMTKCFRQ